MEFEILFYKDEKGISPIEEFIVELGKINRKLTVKTRQGIERLKYRIYHREPLSKYLEIDLWELRVRTGNDILRIVYSFRKGRIIILLHIFIKKKQRTSIRDLEIARKRLKEIRLREVN
jgi:phage-related protein